MKKRGQLVYKALVVIIASAIVIFAFVKAGQSYGNQTAFYKLAIAKDLALTIDTIRGLPGDIELTYPNDVSGYDIEFKTNTVIVYDHSSGKLDPLQASYNYHVPEKYYQNTIIQNANFIKFSKIGDKISVSGIYKSSIKGFGGGHTGGGGTGGS